jgi:hypothetical protein
MPFILKCSLSPFFGEHVSRLIVRRRAASEIVGAILIAIITASISVAYAFWGGTAVSQQASSIVDVIRQATSRQRQLLSLLHARRGTSLELYICNYGTEPSTPERVYVNGQLGSFQLYDMVSKTSCDAINPKRIVRLTLSDPGTPTVDVILVTNCGGIYTWTVGS